ncbi:hypothetical protein [Actinomadura sp. 21ATH]|uniref:hypothetical protein n=1 Tax=Actinomadura sp. 21ATH TaxID=1735444 RepID=UPI0035C02B09
MGARSGAGAFLAGALVTLAGSAAAAVVVAVVTVAAPGTVLGAGFFWTSAAFSVVLHGALGLSGARVAVRRLRDGAPRRLRTAACAGPVVTTCVIQLGVLAEGEAAVALAAIGVACAGAALGAWTGGRRARRAV